MYLKYAIICFTGNDTSLKKRIADSWIVGLNLGVFLGCLILLTRGRHVSHVQC
jgi:hypothetical protein